MRRVFAKFVLAVFLGIFLCPITLPDLCVSSSPAFAVKQEIKIFCDSGLPGRNLYFKVQPCGIDAERVSAVFNNQQIKLYCDDQSVWKGAIMLSPGTKPGNHQLKVYVADREGHLHRELKEFAVKPRPQPEIKSSALRINEKNNFEVAVPPQVNRATLVLENKKIPLRIKDAIASANFYLENNPERKVLFLSDKDGHLFRYPLALDVESEREEAADDIVVDTMEISAEVSDILIKTEEENLNSILLVLLGVTTGLGLWMAFSRKRG